MSRLNTVISVAGKARRQREDLAAFLFLLPATLFIVAFMIYPLIFSGYLAFFEWTGVSEKEFKGFGNFSRLVQDKYFWRSLTNNIGVAVAGIVFQVLLAIVIAYLLVRELHKVKRTYLFLFLVPMVVSEICIGLLWGFI